MNSLLTIRMIHVLFSIFSVISEGYSQIEMSLKVLANKYSTSSQLKYHDATSALAQQSD